MSFGGNGKKISLCSIKQRLYLLIASKLAKIFLCEDVLNTTTASLHDNDPSHDRANTLQACRAHVSCGCTPEAACAARTTLKLKSSTVFLAAIAVFQTDEKGLKKVS